MFTFISFPSFENIYVLAESQLEYYNKIFVNNLFLLRIINGKIKKMINILDTEALVDLRKEKNDTNQKHRIF